MRLLHKTNWIFLLVTTFILLAASLTLMLVLGKMVDDEIDEELRLQYDLTAEQMQQGNLQPSPMSTIVRVPPSLPPTEVFGDSVVYDRVQKMNEEYKYLKVIAPINGQNYRITVMDAHVGWQEFYNTILAVFLLTALLLVFTGTLINYLAARTLWQPFFHNLQVIKQYSVSTPRSIVLRKSHIQEFEDLRVVLEDFTNRSLQEYTTLREFTDNASHETQTPLAIVRSKLDRISQYPMSEEMAEHMVHAKEGVAKLARLNKSLLLLANLENKAFVEKEQVEFSKLLLEQLEQMEELFSLRQIVLQVQCQPVRVSANPYLCEVLLSNMLSNALRYTPTGGGVWVRLLEHTLEISNTGPELTIPQEHIFRRFTKGASSNSTGLGLAITRQVCRAQGWRVQYSYTNGRHLFSVLFRDER